MSLSTMEVPDIADDVEQRAKGLSCPHCKLHLESLVALFRLAKAQLTAAEGRLEVARCGDPRVPTDDRLRAQQDYERCLIRLHTLADLHMLSSAKAGKSLHSCAASCPEPQ